MDGIEGQYGPLAGANYYELEQRKCLVEASEVPARYISGSHRLQIDFKDLIGLHLRSRTCVQYAQLLLWLSASD
jgi:hypothetical protein